MIKARAARDQQTDVMLPSPVLVIFSSVRFSVGSRPALHRLSRRRSLGLNIRLARPANNAPTLVGRLWRLRGHR